MGKIAKALSRSQLINSGAMERDGDNYSFMGRIAKNITAKKAKPKRKKKLKAKRSTGAPAAYKRKIAGRAASSYSRVLGKLR